MLPRGYKSDLSWTKYALQMPDFIELLYNIGLRIQHGELN